MKYIKTKSGHILEFTEELKNDIKEFGWIPILGCLENETKQADTLKELCDAFIICEKPFYLKPYVWKESLEKLFSKNIINNIKSLSIEVYGAIWVKGEYNEPILKPAAKMNDKGDLELLDKLSQLEGMWRKGV